MAKLKAKTYKAIIFILALVFIFILFSMLREIHLPKPTREIILMPEQARSNENKR